MIANVNPIYGLYSGMLNTIVGSLTSSSSLMIISLTNALALVTGSALLNLKGEVKIEALFTLTLLVGLIQLILGLFKLGGIKRFISDSVMTGFIAAAALLIIAGQLKHILGINPIGDNVIERSYNLFSRLAGADIPTLLLGAGTIIIIILFKRSRLKKFSDILGILIGSIFILIVSLPSVAKVGDIAKITNGLPGFALPNLRLIPKLAAAAMAIALLGLTQSAGISSAFPNPGDRRSDPSKDFNSQGLSNVVGSFFQAMPSGGSLSATGINVVGGAKSRWAGIYSGIILMMVVGVAGNLAKVIPLTSLAALLIVTGSLVLIDRWPHMKQIWQISKVSSLAMIVTFLTAIVVSLETAIYTGVLLSLGLYILSAAVNPQLSELIPIKDRYFDETSPPDKLKTNSVTILQVRGNFYFASVFELENRLPKINGCVNAVVIIRLRGRRSIGDTFLNLLINYNHDLVDSGNRLILAGINKTVYKQFVKSGFIEEIGHENVIPATARLQESLRNALVLANHWIGKNKDDIRPDT